MNRDAFIKLLTADSYTLEDLRQVEEICRSYPMFNMAHMVKIRILEKLNLDKSTDLGLAAVYASDRSEFFNYVGHGVSGTSMEIAAALDDDIFFPGEEESGEEIVISHSEHMDFESDPTLLELDTEEGEKKKIEVNGDRWMGSPEKQESEMEEPEEEPDIVVPVIDILEKRSEKEPEAMTVPDSPGENNSLIERFISEDPGPIKPNAEIELKGDVSQESIKESDGLITDTLAKIYLKQGLYAKAIYAYEKLSLKYPEKSAYFAAQIDKIKDLNNS